MGIIYDKNAKEKELYSAYGLTVYGKENRYESIWSPDVKFVFVTLRISDGEKDLVNESLGNNCIFPGTFESTIDNFLWWIQKDKPDEYDIKKTIQKSLCSSDCLFNSRIENRKRREKHEMDEEERCKRLDAERNTKIKEIKQYCEDKNLVFCQNWKGVYLFEVDNERAKETLESADSDRLDSYVNYMKKNSVVDARLVTDGSLDDIYEYIRR